MIGYLRKNFPANVSSDTVKKYGLASKNESYVINALQFIGLIDERGKRTEVGQSVFATHDEAEFRAKFSNLVKSAYSDMFDTYGDDAWMLQKTKLIGYFRQADKTSDIIGMRQAGVFQALCAIAGHEVLAEAKAPITSGPKKAKVVATKIPNAKIDEAVAIAQPSGLTANIQSKLDMALTVRIEINLPAEGTQTTYDAIFKSIKANLYP
jgi:hypothetical protein